MFVNKLKGLSALVSSALQVPSARGYAAKKSLPIKWVRPVPPSCFGTEKSGDGGIDLDVKPEDRILFYENSKELDDADEIVKKMTSVEFNLKKQEYNLELAKAIGMVKRHKFDTNSMEIRFARLTVRILRGQKDMIKFPYNKQRKVQVKEAIEKRQRWLRFLRERDYACFEYILERFNLKFRPGIRPEHFHRVERKWATRKVLGTWCEEQVKKKLDTYRESLEAQQKDFFKEKAEKLEFIRNEEIACGVKPTVTEEQIQAAKDKAATFS